MSTEQPDRAAGGPESSGDAPAEHPPDHDGPAVHGSRLQSSCMLMLVAIVLLIGVAIAVQHLDKKRKLEVQQQRAVEEFAPVFDKMEEARQEEQIDLDKTVEVLYGLDHGVERALANDQSLGQYLAVLAAQDYRGVAPEVLDARRELLDVLMELYGKQTEIEAQQELMDYTGEMLLAMLSVVKVEGAVAPAGPMGGLSVDREQAQEELAELRERHDKQLKLINDLSELETRLFDAMITYADVYYRYVEEWDRLCVKRDRAYLAAYAGEWDKAAEAADAAIAMAPNEKEAHLLKAMALIESGSGESVEALGLLHDYMDRHPDSTAPALLLLGVYHGKAGDETEARLHLEQAAAYYPRQSAQLDDMLDPYRERAFLRKTREGNFIVDQYEATMLGAGYFSPDLQMARMAFAAGDVDGGRTKVMDHFARRRSQTQWDLILSDIQYAEKLLGDDFRMIFPEESYLDLVVKPTLFSDKLKLFVDNRSPKTLHNATLINCIQFTDMHPEDYQTFAAVTQPAVLAYERTDFGELDVETEWFGVTKGVDDIVLHRAVLVSNEAVLWVDTDEYKIAEAEEFRRARRDRRSGLRGSVTPDQRDNPLVERAVDALNTDASLTLDSKLLKDQIEVVLPREFSVLKPIFRLRNGGDLVEPSENMIVEDTIRLRFDEFGGLDAENPVEIELEVHSVLTDMVLIFEPFGAGGGYHLKSVRVQ